MSRSLDMDSLFLGECRHSFFSFISDAARMRKRSESLLARENAPIPRGRSFLQSNIERVEQLLLTFHTGFRVFVNR